MGAISEFFHAIPLDLIIIQTVNGIVTGMILALIASGLYDSSGLPSRRDSYQSRTPPRKGSACRLHLEGHPLRKLAP